jgi:hypothetical protein
VDTVDDRINCGNESMRYRHIENGRIVADTEDDIASRALPIEVLCDEIEFGHWAPH